MTRRAATQIRHCPRLVNKLQDDRARVDEKRLERVNGLRGSPWPEVHGYDIKVGTEFGWWKETVVAIRRLGFTAKYVQFC